MNQFLLGASVPYAIALLIYAGRRFRTGPVMLIVAPLMMAVGGVWAIVPDLPRILGWYELYDRLARDPRSDLFFWHYSIDQTEGLSIWFNVLFVLMLASLLMAAWRELRIRERR